jgi:hypothetical protein
MKSRMNSYQPFARRWRSISSIPIIRQVGTTNAAPEPGGVRCTLATRVFAKANLSSHPAALATLVFVFLTSRGTRAEIVVPRLGSDWMDNSPPTKCSLSRMLMSPSP